MPGQGPIRKRGEALTLEHLKAQCVITERGCWEWQRAMSGRYPVLTVDGETVSGHRAAFELSGGVLPPGFMALHDCDNAVCVNPEHLYAGTHQDNMTDRNTRKRTALGLRNGKSKVTPDQVAAIRSDKRASRAVAEEYGIGKTTVNMIRGRNTWRHLD